MEPPCSPENPMARRLAAGPQAGRCRLSLHPSIKERSCPYEIQTNPSRFGFRHLAEDGPLSGVLSLPPKPSHFHLWCVRFVFGSWRFPVHSGYLTQLRNLPNLLLRSTSQPSSHSGQIGNVAPQLQVSCSGLAGSFVGKSWPHTLHGFSFSPQRRPCSQL